MPQRKTVFNIFGIEVAANDLAVIVGMSRSGVKAQIARMGSAEAWARYRGIFSAEELRRAISVSDLDAMTVKQLLAQVFVKEKRMPEPERAPKMSYCEKIRALGFEPFQSEIDRELRGEVL